jgi:hypothetical protein
MKDNVKISAKQAIKSYCKGCIYDPANPGTWVQQVEDCTVTHCELYEHRPLTSKTRRLNDEKYLASLPQGEREFVINKRQNRAQKLLYSRNNGEL